MSIYEQTKIALAKAEELGGKNGLNCIAELDSTALEQAKEILIRHFGGYTIQEAHGGWIDGETEYQEYTLVIYLSDTTLDQVHAAADEMIETFRQSSVLIQENPTRTEFYAGK